MDELPFLLNASATHDDLVENGPPANPLAFDGFSAGQAERVKANVLNPVTGNVMEVNNIVYERHADNRPPARGYWLGRTLKKAIFGAVKECSIVQIRNCKDVPWQVTDQRAAVKIISKERLRTTRHVEDPLQEISAMRYVQSEGEHPNVMALYDVLEDSDYILMFMPFCTSGDLFSAVQESGRFTEPVARFWFRQILDGLAHLQRMGVCHRDMSLENLMVHESTQSIIIDLGMALRVPYDEDGVNVTDVSAGTLRRLLKPLVPCGKPNYITPEIFASNVPFDGFSIDLFAAGVILFIMIVGLPPWETATSNDPRFRVVAGGGLARMVQTWGRELSPLAADLLQRMLNADPRNRLSLMQVREHEWVAASDDDDEQEQVDVVANLKMLHQPSADEGWRN
jgi:serine/threonine protein kinase